MKFITHCSGIELRRMLAALAIVSIALGCNTFDVEARVSSVVSQASDTNNAGFAHAGQTALMQSPAPTTEPVATEDNAETGDDTFPETTAEMAHGTFTGQVRNHSTDQPVGSDVRVLLYVIDDRFQEEVLTTVTDENGRYRFDNVPVQTGWHYLVSAQYGDGYFTGGMVAGTPNNPDVDLPVPVYDVTDDPSVISIGSVLTQVVPIESGLRMVQVFQFVNDSGQLFVTNETIDDAHNASVVVPLPAGAQVQSFNDQQRYVLSADGQSVISVDPVFPDETHIVHVMYTLPYSDSTRVEQTINYRLNGSVEVIAPDVLSIESTQLTTGSAEVIDGNRFLTYAGDLTLARGETLYYEVQGNLVSGGIESGAFMDNTALTVALSSLAILLVIAGVWVYWRRQQPPVESTAGAHDQSTIDSLVSQIADLDRLHQAGQLETEAYRAERERLKARLSRLMKEQ